MNGSLKTSRDIFLILTAALCFVFTSCANPIEIENLRLVEVEPYSAALAWNSAHEETFTVLYGEGTLFDREITTEARSKNHEVKLTGLKPSTRYSYRIEPSGASASFRSAPAKDGAFDIAVLDSGSPACGDSGAGFDTNPDIVILASNCPGAAANHPESILTLGIPDDPIRLKFGNSSLIIASDIAALSENDIDGTKEKTIAVTKALPDAAPEFLLKTPIISPRGALLNGVKTLLPKEQSAFLEVDAFEIAFAESKSDAHARTVIVEAPPETRKTCLYCDRLLESGRYEESLSWYRNFVAENRDRHAVEDAYFSMARLLDEKLFRYNQAIGAYEEFLKLYPKSRKTMLAEYRLEYLRGHSDADFKPLQIFDKAKAGLVRGDPMPAVVKVESLLANYPDSSVSREALYWLGHILETKDPRHAIGHYRNLIEKYPDGDDAVAASIALGDIAYRAKRYLRAIENYRAAAKNASDKFTLSIEDKLRKSHRNVYREIARWASWFILAAWLAITLLSRPDVAMSDLRRSAFLIVIYAFVGGIYFGLTYEMSKVLLPLISSMAVIMSLILFTNRTLGRGKWNFPWIIAAHMVSCCMAALYLIMYHFHQLYVFGF